jgi:hypothetical protein
MTTAQPNATITTGMKVRLHRHGYTNEQIDTMTAQQAHELLRANGKAAQKQSRYAPEQPYVRPGSPEMETEEQDPRPGSCSAGAETEEQPAKSGGDDKPMVEHALALAAEGRAVFPLNPWIDPGPDATDEEREKASKAAKAPRSGLIGGHKNATVNTAQIRAWWAESPQSNIGVLCTHHPVVDLDPRNGGNETFAALPGERKESLQRAPQVRTPSGGIHFGPFTLPDDAEPLRTGTDRLGPGLDMPSYVVGPGSVINGKRYERIHDAPVVPCPEWIREKAGAARRPKPRPAAERIAPSPELVCEAVARIPNDDVDWDAYNTMLMAIWAASDGEDIESAHLWAEKSCKYVPADVDARWAHYSSSSPPTEVGWATLLERARRADPTWHMAASGFPAYEMPEREQSQHEEPEEEPGPSPGEEAPIEIEMFDALADMALDECGDPLVDGIIERGTMSTWYGGPKSYKSFIVLSLALMVAMGKRWAGRETHKGAVVYVALEGGRGVLKRLRALQMQHPDSKGAPLAVLRKPLNMRRLADREHLAAYCREVTRLTGLPVELIVIDTVARAMAGANENAPDAMSDFVNVIDRLRKQTGAHVALIHHSGKDPTKGARGHSSLLGALDSEFEIKKQGDNAGLITSTAQRDIEDNVSFQFTRKIVPLGMDAKGRVVTSCQITISPAGREQVDTWPKSLRLFRKCLLEAIESDGEKYRPNGKRGPVVQAVAVDVVRELHRQQYVNAGDMDATVAASQAWRRAWTKVTNEKLVGAANVGARAVVWYGQ